MNTEKRLQLKLGAFGLPLSTLALPLVAQSGGPYEIVSSTIAAGGVQESTGAGHQVSATTGLPELGVMGNGPNKLAGGFCPTVTSDRAIFSEGFESADIDQWSKGKSQEH